MSEHKDLVRAYLLAADSRDVTYLMQVLHPSVLLWFPDSVVQRGVAHPIEGADAASAFLTRGGNYQVGTAGWDIHTLVEEDDYVAARMTRVAIRHDGSPYRNEYQFFFRFDGDQIAEIWAVPDTANAFAKLPAVGPDGVPPEPDPR